MNRWVPLFCDKALNGSSASCTFEKECHCCLNPKARVSDDVDTNGPSPRRFVITALVARRHSSYVLDCKHRGANNTLHFNI
jgi:hypothetical protein